MAVTGKLIMYVDINSRGDLFHDMLRHKPHDLASISPDKAHGCDVDGEAGAVGSVLCWNYTHDIDEKKHKIVFNAIGGDLLGDLYKSFKLVFHVEPKDNGELAIWTFEFEKLNISVPYPTTFMDYKYNYMLGTCY
ncbi:MLP-like protein 28 [Cynara cardunculus var. scolymus]|uniref:MLP-like protein 28 n=1 Tax=Cynara cardunculus var. scolymus TaxID=59895 RepID=UPI000D626B8D|nr:MLP-like protein 28 [Cynara cardunculus var. scolymus]